MPRNIVCWDFDHSLILYNGHRIMNDLSMPTHFKKEGIIVRDQQGQFCYLDPTQKPDNLDKPSISQNIVERTQILAKASPEYGPRSPQEIAQAFRDVWANDDENVILSFSQFPEMIEPILTLIGLSNTEIARVYIACGLPIKTQTADSKAGHFAHIMQHFKCASYAEIILLDDTQFHVDTLNQLGGNGIWINPATSTPAAQFLKPLYQKLGLKRNPDQTVNFDLSNTFLPRKEVKMDKTAPSPKATTPQPKTKPKQH